MSLDIPEVLILFGLVLSAVWAVYNWTHRDTGLHK